MKTKSIYLILTILSIFISCTEKEWMGTEKSRHIIVTAHMPESGNNTRASLSQKEGSLDFLTQWDEGDAVNLFTEQDGRFYEVEYTRPGALPGEVSFNFIPVKNISEDRKSCTIEFDLPEGVDADRPYKIFGSTFERGVVGYLDDDSEVLDLEYYLFDGIYRTTNMSIPLYCEIESTALSAGAKFKHFLAYEILHIKNNSDETITFTHNGFDVNKPWYHLGCGICFWPTYHKVLTERFKDDDSGERIEINAGETKDILSCYYPTGDKIENARLKATINGNEVLSSNTKSSGLDIEPAKAYHMYATWNGKELKFGDGDDVNYGEFALDNNSCSLKIDEEKTVQITGGSGSFDVSCDNTNVATALLNDMKITVRGVAGGMATITVRDKMTGIEKQINVFVSGNNGDKYICHNKTIDGVTYCIYKQYDRNSKITNAGKSPFYKSELVMEITKDGVTTVHTIGKDLYLADNYWNGMVPCVMLDQSSRMMYIFMASKNGSGGYDENGYMYLSSIDAIDFKRETVFSAKNWGWFPYFKGYENEKIAISHFSYNGYEEMKALRSSDGKWSNSTVRDISPANASKNWYNATLFLVLPAEGGMPIPDDKPVDDVPPDGDVID